MVQTLTFQDFVDAFRARGREDQFSYEALRLIFDWYEENAPEYDLDVIGICCEWVEVDPSDIHDYGVPRLNNGTEEEQHEVTEDFLSSETTYLGTTDDTKSYVFAQF